MKLDMFCLRCDRQFFGPAEGCPSCDKDNQHVSTVGNHFGHTCHVCKQNKKDIRIRTDRGLDGPVDVQTCEDCHIRDGAAIKAEARRLGFPTRVKNWFSLTTKGFYSIVQ